VNAGCRDLTADSPVHTELARASELKKRKKQRPPKDAKTTTWLQAQMMR
jgi:hypothetical protein